MSKQFTLVFEGDIREFAGNPFKTDTPFGRPVAAGDSNAFAQLDEAEEVIAAMTANIEAGAKAVDVLKRQVAREEFVASSPTGSDEKH